MNPCIELSAGILLERNDFKSCANSLCLTCDVDCFFVQRVHTASAAIPESLSADWLSYGLNIAGLCPSNLYVEV